MSIFSGAVAGLKTAATELASALNFDWLSGTAVLPDITEVQISLAIPEDYIGPGVPGPRWHQGHLKLQIPNHSAELGAIAINMAQNALLAIETAVALQSISSPGGGINIKDQLDPYHYQVIKDALEENNEPVPPVANPDATILNQLGGAVTEYGLLSNLATAADALGTVKESFNFLKITPQGSLIPHKLEQTTGVVWAETAQVPGTPAGFGTPIVMGFGPTAATDGFWPSLSLPLQIMNSAVQIQGFVQQYTVSILRNAIDTGAGALVTKNTMADFTKSVSDNAINNVGQTPPEWEEPKGTPGVTG
jgi:hypothetical protein